MDIQFQSNCNLKTQKTALRVSVANLIILFFIVVILADGANQILKYLDFNFFRVSIFIRFAGLIFFLLLLIYKRKAGIIIAIIVFFYGVFLIGSLATSHNYENYLWFENFSMINKMLFFFIVVQTLRTTFTNQKNRDRLFLVFEYILLLQSIVVILSFLFRIEMFASYRSGIRFGYDGLIPARNEASAFFVIAFFYFLWKFHIQQKGLIQLFLVALAALITGTKVVLVIPIIILMYVTREIIGMKGLKLRKQYFFATMIVLSIVTIAFLQSDFIINTITPTLNYYSVRLDKLGFSILDILLSGRHFRTEVFISEFLPRFNFVNYIFGGHDIAKFATESDLVDVFIRLGLIGGSLFFFLYLKFLLPTGQPITFTHLLFVFIWIGISVTAGHIVFSAINGGYLAILVFFISTTIYPIKQQSKLNSVQ